MNDDEFLNDRDCTPKPQGETPKAGAQVPLVEQLRSVPMDARHIVCDTSKDFAESRNIPYGRMCHEAADEIARITKAFDAASESLSASLRGGLQSARYAQELEDERVRLNAELARALRVVEAAKELAANCEEYEFDDGLGYAAQGMWWHDLDNALEEWGAGR